MRQDAAINQLIYEAESWGRWLAFFQQENFYFKMRLADMVSNSKNDDVLVMAEKFQEDFLSQDRVISFLKEELKKQNKLLESEADGNGQLLQEISYRQKAFENNIKKEEELFYKIKDSFHNYLSQHIDTA